MVRRFYLERDIDPSGVSGTGIIAYGAQFGNDRIALYWFTRGISSFSIFDNISDMLEVHGHNGLTHLHWIDTYDPCINFDTIPERTVSPSDGAGPYFQSHGGN